MKTEVPSQPAFLYSRADTGADLLVVPGQELKTMRAEEDSLLKSYAWVDREKGIVRIPIQRAIDIVARGGIRSRPQGKKRPATRNKSHHEVQATDSRDLGMEMHRQSVLIGNSTSISLGLIVVLAVTLILLVSAAARAHDDNRPAALRDVAFDQKLNQQVPLDLTFRDENGKMVLLG